MLDTNIWIHFVLIQWKLMNEQRIHDELKRSYEIMKLWNSQKFISVISKWNLWEIRDQLSKLFLERKFVENGYALTEFGEAKKVLNLEEKDKEVINDLIKTIKISSLYKNIPIQYRMIDFLVERGFSYMDAILIFQAHMNPYCQYFVTRDKVLINQIKNLGFQIGGVKIINRKEFLNLFK